jgi:hypothetical protein
MFLIEAAFQDPLGFMGFIWFEYEIATGMKWSSYSIMISDKKSLRNDHFEWILSQLEFRHGAAVVVKKLGDNQTGKLLRSLGLEILKINMERLQAWDNREEPPLPCAWPVKAGMTQADASAALRTLENLDLVKTDRPTGAKKRATKVRFTLVGWQAFIFQTDPFALFTSKGVWNNPDGRGVTLASPALQNEYVKFCESRVRQ